MASHQHTTTMEKLPNDVLSNIFIRLLAKQLAQMRSVSKSWNSLLSKKSFIKSHLHHSFHNNDEVLLFFHEISDFYNIEPFFAHSSRSPSVKLTNFIKPPVNFRWNYDSVVGSVNGLICLRNGSNPDDCVFQIWNPSLSALLTLPPCSMPSPDIHPTRIHLNFRFGFDPKADDYKVVKIGTLLRKGPIFQFKFDWLPVEVYSMRKGSWKLITQPFPSHITWIPRQHEVCVDGHDGFLHWLGFIDEKRHLQTIVVFDLGVETFSEISLPDSLVHHNVSRCINALGFLAGKLCVMSYAIGGECEVWVMVEYGVVESWVKHHAFSQFCNISPFGFTLGNEFLFHVEKIAGDDEFFSYHRFGLYDPVAAKTKFFKICYGIMKIVGYVDSLVWVAHNEHELS